MWPNISLLRMLQCRMLTADLIENVAIQCSVEIITLAADPLMKKSPNLRDIANWLSDRAAVWRKIGVSLNVKGGMLDSIQHNVTFSDANRLTEVFEEWRRTVCSPHTFEHLIKCLEDINEVDAAKTIKEKFKDPQVIAEYSNKPDYK